MTTKHGEHYTDGEIELLWRCEKNPHNNDELANVLGRTPDAIDWVQRHLDEADAIGPRWSAYLSAQATLVRARLGDEARGRIVRLEVGLL